MARGGGAEGRCRATAGRDRKETRRHASPRDPPSCEPAEVSASRRADDERRGPHSLTHCGEVASRLNPPARRSRFGDAVRVSWPSRHRGGAVRAQQVIPPPEPRALGTGCAAVGGTARAHRVRRRPSGVPHAQGAPPPSGDAVGGTWVGVAMEPLPPLRTGLP
jgi:hypothetical protein